MPLYEFKCEACGRQMEILVFGAQDDVLCTSCGSARMTKLISAHSSMSGPVKNTVPGFKDTACCGSSPGEAQGCAGPGSCCGKKF